MKYLKLKNKWRIIETGEEIKFGSFIIGYYEFWYAKYNEWSDKLYNMLEQDISLKDIDESAKEFWVNEQQESEIETFLSIMDDYLGDNNAKTPFKTFLPKEVKRKWDKSINLQEQLHNGTIERIKENGWIDISQNYDINLIDLYLLRKCNMDKIKVSITHHLYKNKWYPAYNISDNNEDVLLAMVDLQELRNQNYNFKRCKQCHKIFIQKDGRNKYCKECSEKYKKIADQKRKQTPRGKHKIVCNYLRNAGSFSDIEIGDFMRESNYYWDNLQGKSVEREKAFTSNISTEEEYVFWLEKCHNDFKSEAKKRKHT